VTLEAAPGHCAVALIAAPSLAPIIVVSPSTSRGLDPAAIHHNTSGTVDVGLAQVNSANFGLAGPDHADGSGPLPEPCGRRSVWFAKYNGNPPDAIKAIYAARVMVSLARASLRPSRRPHYRRYADHQHLSVPAGWPTRRSIQTATFPRCSLPASVRATRSRVRILRRRQKRNLQAYIITFQW
jgi:hypothetical protein